MEGTRDKDNFYDNDRGSRSVLETWVYTTKQSGSIRGLGCPQEDVCEKSGAVGDDQVWDRWRFDPGSVSVE